MCPVIRTIADPPSREGQTDLFSLAIVQSRAHLILLESYFWDALFVEQSEMTM